LDGSVHSKNGAMIGVKKSEEGERTIVTIDGQTFVGTDEAG
jgi:hypothetical protein